MPYIGSYFYSLDPSINISDFVMVMPIGQLSSTVCRLIVGYGIRYIYPYWIFLFGTLFVNIGMFFCSYITNPIFFCWAYGLFLGGLPGFTFLPTVWNLWGYFPKTKGQVSGILLASGNFGPVIFTLIFTMVANPFNYEAEIVEVDGQEKQKAFGTFVSERVPMTIRWCAIISQFFCLIGYILLPHSKNKENPESTDKEVPTLSFTDMLKSLKAWNLFFLLATTSAASIYIQTMYKVLGMIYINDDHYISFIGSGGFALACVGRLIFGFLYDKYPLKRILLSCMLISIVFIITFNISFSSKFLFALYFFVLSFIYSAFYSGVLLQGAKDFPRDKWVFSYASAGFFLSFLLVFILQRFVTPIIGYFSTLLIISGITSIAAVQVLLLPGGEMRTNEVLPEKEEFIDKD